MSRPRNAACAGAPAVVAGAFGDDATFTWLMGRGGDLLVAVWFDDGAFGGGGGGNGNHAYGEVYLSPRGDPLTIRTSTVDGRSGTIAIGGTHYDLSRGALFLAYTKEKAVRVVQLTRHFSGEAASREAIAAMAHNDPDVAPFIRRARGAEKPAVAPAEPGARAPPAHPKGGDAKR